MFAFALAFFLAPFLAHAQASMSIVPSAGTYGVGKTFTVTVLVDSTQGFNSGGATLNFDKDVISVQSVSKNGSAFTLWPVEPASNNTAGTITFEGGSTPPALTGKKTLLTITFKALKEGKATVGVASGSVYAADGKGTDILGPKNSASYDITATGGGDSPPAPPPPPPAPEGPLPELPEIITITHPSDTVYSSAATAKFTWDLPFDVTAVRFVLDEKANTVPTTNYDPPVAEKEYDDIVDGTRYFHLRFRNDVGWGPTAHKKILIDKTPPPEFTLEATVAASATDAVLSFTATDTLSGIDRYEISVDSGDPRKVALDEVKEGTFTLSGQDPGKHDVTVTAFDKAGNKRSASAEFTIEGELPSATKPGTVAEEEEKPTDWRLFGEIGLVAILAFLIGYLWYERNAFRHEKYLIKREADELRDNLSSIFGALREEMGEQVGRLFQKPNPSAEDRKVMENINEAADLSEELISKEIEDVRKLLM